ncbi:MAG TPA: ABC transporter permease [Bryobacteraceae bacterium]|nr:ABC transporter permease [Bryobacteraceae bacterium]
MLLDLRFGIRMLFRNPAFTLVAILTLAIGIGANTAVFSVIDAVLLRPLPYGHSERLVRIWEKRPRIAAGSVSFADFADWRRQSKSLEGMSAYTTGDYTLTGSADPEQIHGAAISASLLGSLDAKPRFGRAFSIDDDKPGANPVVILSYGLWERRFGSDPAIIGRQIGLNGSQYTVVGVMPESFYFPTRQIDLWEPLAIDPTSRMAGRGMHILNVVARVTAGSSVDQARSEMATIATQLEKAYPRENTGHGVNVVPLLEDTTNNYRSSLLVLLGAVVFVLLIACGNVVNLLLARATGRQREMAIRTALGAGRLRIIRQLLMESLVLSLLGGLFGLVGARWLIRLIVAMTPGNVPRIGESGLNLPVLAFTLLIAAGAGVLFGLAPALRISEKFRGGLVVAEVALSLVLLIGTGLLVKSLVLLNHVNPGFQPANVLTANINLRGANYRPVLRQALAGRVLERLRSDPQVQAAGGVTHLPLAGNGPSFNFDIEGRPPAAPGEEFKAQLRCATPDYFKAMGIPILAGRTLSEQDTADTPNVVVINDVAAQRFWPSELAIGKRIRLDTAGWREVVGVVQGVRHTSLESAPEPQMYAPYSQFSMPFLTLVVRTRSEPMAFAASVRRAVSASDPRLAVSDIRSMEDVVEGSVGPRRFNLLLLSGFAGIALVLAAIGIYGVLSYSVDQRSTEIGIRMAIGADRGTILWLIIRKGMLLTAIGILAGMVGAAGLLKLLASMLYGVGLFDSAVFGFIATLLFAVALVASYLPAARATRLDPVAALRKIA